MISGKFWNARSYDVAYAEVRPGSLIQLQLRTGLILILTFLVSR